MSDRPKPPGSGPCGKVMVADCWYDYLNADRDWALAELQRYREALETAAARYESLMKDTFNCGDPHVECPMQDSCKPYHMTGELKRFRTLLAEPKNTQS